MASLDSRWVKTLGRKYKVLRDRWWRMVKKDIGAMSDEKIATDAWENEGGQSRDSREIKAIISRNDS